MSDHDTVTPEADDELRARFRAFAVEVAERTDTEAALQRLPRRSATPTIKLLAIAACLVAVALVAAALLVDRASVDTISPSEPPSTTRSSARDASRGALEPGIRYYVDPDGDGSTPLRVTFEAVQAPTAEPWRGWFGTVKFVPNSDDGFTGLSITTVTNVVTDGCRDHTALDPPVGPTVDDLATALSRLEPFEVTAPPTDVTLGGHRGTHLALTVPALPSTRSESDIPEPFATNNLKFTDCVDGELYSWISPLNDYRSNGLLLDSPEGPTPGAFNAYQTPGQTEEFWILDVDGTRVVIVKFTSPGSPATDIAERDAMFDSIRIEP